MLRNWLPQSVQRFRTNRPATARKAAFRPRLEVLEDRLVLATRIWDGGAASNNWTNATNWQGNIAPVAGDNLVFPAGNFDKTADNNFSSDTFFNSITVGGGYTLRGIRVALGSGGIISSGSSNIIKHKINLGGAGNGNRPFHVSTGSTLFIDDDIVGSNGLQKTGTGNLSFRNNNSYSGLTDIQAGILFIEKDNSLGAFNTSGAGTIIRSGATLLVNDQAVGTIRTDEPITIADGGTIRALNDVELRGNLGTVGTGTLRHEGGLIERLLVTGQISGSGGITIANTSGQVRFFGSTSNSYQGLTTVFGELNLDHDNTAIPGTLIVNSGGQVRLQRGEQIADFAAVTVNGTGRFELNAFNETIGSLTMVGGFIRGGGANPFTSFTGTLHVSGEFHATSSSAAQSADFNNVLVELLAPNRVIDVANGPALNDVVFNASLFSGFTKEGTGTLIHLQKLTSDPVYVVNAGLLRMHTEQKNARVTVNASGEFSGNGTIGTLIVNAGGRVRPGPLSSTGILKIKDNLVLNPGAILEVTLKGVVAGSGHDQLDVGGTVTITGAILEPTLGSSASVGQQYRIINNGLSDGVVGSFLIPAGSAPFLLALPTNQRLSISHAAGSLNNDVVVTLQNTPPMAPDIAIDQTEIDEGSYVTVTGHLVDPDPGARLRLLINWGDGTPVQTVRPGRADFTFRHRYHDDGQYVASFVWLDQFGQGNRREFNVTVNNVPPAAFLDLTLDPSAPVLFANLVIHDPGRDQLLATVNFGDGTPTSDFTLGKRRNLAFQHRYGQPGSYTLTLTLRDGDGGVTTFQREVTM